MLLGKVVSRVVATARLPTLPQDPMLCVEPLPGFGDPKQRLVAIDRAQAGPGDTVVILQEGTGARQVVYDDLGQPLPAQAVVVGVVDEIQTSAN